VCGKPKQRKNSDQLGQKRGVVEGKAPLLMLLAARDGSSYSSDGNTNETKRTPAPEVVQDANGGTRE
jgi:hypothetical protein